jgi:hypothetical protein
MQAVSPRGGRERDGGFVSRQGSELGGLQIFQIENTSIHSLQVCTTGMDYMYGGSVTSTITETNSWAETNTVSDQGLLITITG